MKKAIITGSSKGIGKAIALYLLESGFEVLGIARTQTIEHETYTHKTANLADRKAVIDLADQLKKMQGSVDVFIASAGFGNFAELEQLSYANVAEQLDVNLFSAMTLSKSILPQVKKSQGKMVFLGSEAGIHPHKKATAYCAAKFGLRGFVQSLRLECVPRKVGVSLLSLGLVDSSFYDNLSFVPADAPENKIQIAQVIDAVKFIVAMENNACIEEIVISPMKHVVVSK